MSLKFKVGQQVTQVVKPIVGEVSRVMIVDDDQVVYMVKYLGQDGEQHERAFAEDNLE